MHEVSELCQYLPVLTSSLSPSLHCSCPSGDQCPYACLVLGSPSGLVSCQWLPRGWSASCASGAYKLSTAAVLPLQVHLCLCLCSILGLHACFHMPLPCHCHSQSQGTQGTPCSSGWSCRSIALDALVVVPGLDLCGPLRLAEVSYA